MTDRLTVRMVVVVLSAAALVGLALVGVLAYQAKPIPGELVGLASGALSAVAALLVRTGSERPAR